jgi:hypothetical protein
MNPTLILDAASTRVDHRRMPGRVRIGAGAGFADDRIDPAVELVERGELDFLVFECLAERTIALRQLERRRDPGAGFDPLLRERMTVLADRSSLPPLADGQLPMLGLHESDEVGGVDAAPVLAEVVKLESRRDRPRADLVRDPVSVDRTAVVVDLPVAHLGDARRPRPALVDVSFVDLLPEAGGQRSRLRWHRTILSYLARLRYVTGARA